MAEIKPLKISTTGDLARFQSSDVIPVEHGGTGATTNLGAVNNLLPPQTGQNGKVLGTDGADVIWVDPALQGYTGSQGVQGVQGVTGFTGSQGVQGNIGYTGSAGTTGATGYTGSVGSTVADVNAAAPSSPVIGQMWYDTSTSALKIYLSGGWTAV